MGLTKQYLAYRNTGNCGIIASERGNINFLTLKGKEGRYVAVAGAENVIIWDLRLGTQEFLLRRQRDGEQCEVTAIRGSPDNIHLAAGYTDGTIEIFNLQTRQSVCSFSVHKSAVTILRYDEFGMRLVSGGNDTDLVVCDIISQQGKYRLSGHTGPITDVHFYDANTLITSSKDTQIKFWSIETQFCYKTIVDHRSEVWCLAFMTDNKFMVSGSNEKTLNVYRITPNTNLDEAESPLNCNLVGQIHRSCTGRVVGLVADPNGRILGCHGKWNNVDLFYFYSDEESKKRLTKRMKKLRLKKKDDDPTTITEDDLSLSDEIKRLNMIKVKKNQIKSIDLLIGVNDELRTVMVLDNNSIKLFSMRVPEKSEEPSLIRSIQHQGHHHELRSVCFNSDGNMFVTGAGDGVKVWNSINLTCVRTIETDYVISTCFVPGDRHILVGLKSGILLIVDIISGEILESIEAHKNEIWSICLLPDLRGCVTGGSDETVKFWQFELIDRSDVDVSGGEVGIQTNEKILSLLHKNTLKVDDNVMCLRISSNNKFIAIALYDSTVKIFFVDSFKFFLTLYGHKLPVLCMDIAYDNSIIITGSADRNIKIWGMDFGDCHGSIFGHDDSIMDIRFIPQTHMFLSCGKDGKVKQWDADIRQKILTFGEHFGEVRSLAISGNGQFFVSVGGDRRISFYQKTDEIVVLKDLQEDEREAVENRILATGDDTNVHGLPGMKLPSKKTIGAERSAETILECLDVLKSVAEDPENDQELKNMMIGYAVETPDDYLMQVLTRIRSNDLEEALVILPFSYVCQLLQRLPILLEQSKDQSELLFKITFFLFRIHQRPIVNHKTLLPIIKELIPKINNILKDLRDCVGVNYHTLQLLQRNLQQNEGIELFVDATKARKDKVKKQKQRQVKKRLHIQMKG